MGFLGDAMREVEHRRSGRAQAEAHPGVSDSPDLDRILALPRRLAPLAVGIEGPPVLPHDLTDMFARPEGRMQLRPAQNAILWEAMQCGGLVGAVGVGHGKTLASLLLSDVLAADRPMLLVPAYMREQLFADHERYGRHFNLAPLMLPRDLEGKVWPPGVIVVVSYQELSSPHTADILERLRPDLIVCDEAHALRYRSSARTRRFLRYARRHPETRYVFLSGTITSKSIRDYGHLMELALRAGAPTPRSWYELKDWAEALDAGPMPIPPGALTRLCRAGENPREGYRRRLIETPGVIVTTEAGCKASLIIHILKPPLPPALRTELARLRTTWALGNEEFTMSMEMASAARQLTTGFYYEWDWPAGPDEEWLAARSGWSKALRQHLARHASPGADSPHLVTLATVAGHLPHLRPAWDTWDAVRQRPIPPTRAVWVDEYLVDLCVEWVKERESKGQRGIIWYEHEAFGAALRARGLDVYGAGSSDGGALLLAKSPVICCSRHAHGQGKNLQDWNWNLVVHPPASGSSWEQLLGRTHRQGQLADEVIMEVLLHTPENFSAWQTALADAVYAYQTTGLQQKLIIATKVNDGVLDA